MKTTRQVVNASKAGQQHGALVRAAAINAALSVRDAAVNATDMAIDGVEHGATATKRVADEVVVPRVKAGAAYATSFVRTLFGV